MVLVTDSPTQTQQLGETLGRLIRPGDLICLAGELGVGKTTLATGIARGWGALEAVNSPTFVLVNEYSRANGERLYHLDAYRLQNAEEAEGIGLLDLLSDPQAALLIEWPERVKAALPADRLWIALSGEDDQRRLGLSGQGARYTSYIETLKTLAAP